MATGANHYYDKWEDGIYEICPEDRLQPHTHGEAKGEDGIKMDSPGGMYGPDGIFRATPWYSRNMGRMRTAMGIHYGRYGIWNTRGCVRVRERQTMLEIKDAIREHGGLTKIIIYNNWENLNQSMQDRADDAYEELLRFSDDPEEIKSKYVEPMFKEPNPEAPKYEYKFDDSRSEGIG